MTISPLFPFRRYETPHDLLLDLLELHGVPIEELPLAPIAAEYLAYFRAAQEHNLHLDIEWLHMAATLIQWKSRSLLPPSTELEAEQPDLRAELVEQLRKYVRAAAEALREGLLITSSTFSRASIETFEDVEPSEIEDEPFFSLFDLIRLFEVLERQAQAIAKTKKQPAYEVAGGEVTVAEMTAWLHSKLTEHTEDTLDATALLDQQANTGRRNCLFLAMLEAAKNFEVALHQDGSFEPIQVQRGPIGLPGAVSPLWF